MHKINENIYRHWRYIYRYFFLSISVAPFSFLLSFFIINGHINLKYFPDFIGHISICTLLWILVILYRKEFIIDRQTNTIDNIAYTWKTFLIYTFFIFTYLFILKKQDYGRLFNTYALVFIAVFSSLNRIIMLRRIRRIRRQGRDFVDALIIGSEKFSADLFHFFKVNTQLGIQIKYIFDDLNYTNNSNLLPIPVQNIDTLKQQISTEKIYSEYIFICKDMRFEELMNWSDFCDEHMIKLRCIVNAHILSHISKAHIINYHNIPMLAINYTPLDKMENLILKRAFDLIVSSIVIIFLLSWLIPILGLLIILESKGPVFFRQKRLGLGRKPFNIYKLRTMYQNSDADEKTASIQDQRITNLGKFLRNTSLDELPQFFNVFLGDMSIVGPRPMMLRENERFGYKVYKFMTRHLIKPGITGLAQVRGFRGGAGTRIISGRTRLDRLYIYNWSFLLDIKILLLTIFAIFKKGNSY